MNCATPAYVHLITSQLRLADKIKSAYPYLLLCAYGLFSCGYFFLQDYSDHYRVYARFVFLIGLAAFAAGLRGAWPQALLKLVLLYMAYLLLSGFWSEPFDWYRLGQKATIALFLLNFIAITWVLVNWNHRLYNNMLRLCVLIAAVAGTVSIAVFYQDNPFPGTRMDGLGSLTNVNEFSNIYGVFALLGMGYALQTQHTALKAALLLAVGLFLTYAWLGQSRTAFLSMLIALSCMMCLTLQNRKIALAAVAVLACFGVALLLLFPEAITGAADRGAGLRPRIWAATWDQAIAMPITGHGLASTLSVTVGNRHFETAHNAFLQVFWHGGIIGLGIFLALLGTASKMAWSRGRNEGDYTLFCILLFTLCIMTTGVDTLIERPRDQWMLFWLPLALLLSHGNSGSAHMELSNTSRP